MAARAASAILLAVAGLLLLAMMGLTVADVVGRYLFSAPVNGAFEATQIMLALTIFAGLPLVTARGEHVTVRLAIEPLPVAAQRAFDRLADLVSALLLAGAAYLLYRRGVVLGRFGDATMILGVPLSPVAYVLAALSAIASLAAVVRLVTGGRGRLA